MRKFLQALAASVVGMSLMVGVAAASTSCTITNTGSGSVNTCYNATNNSTTIFCTNNVQVTTENYQQATSGTATVTGNATGGNATSGDASNTALNNAAVSLGCETAAATSTTPTTPTSPQVLATSTTKSQVVAPTGAVHAGGGAGVKDDHATAAAGVISSFGIIALGLIVRKRVLSL